ncbi:isoprenoid biosynthesis glyoxalase ElbB [Holophaga foetida]|uniref:isoprenoid biosynthesis glyoxalase ElbB n=1 Tax=Holophaga foetida TaxID=35839 RepID=UPI00024717E2|nr:isoprenoid biosynthesis glyoxalase ElbB [Holophaga foetida]
MPKSPRIAVLLAGCGHVDGAEIREAVLALLALDQQGVQVQCVAPDAPQHHVFNHATGQVAVGSRNILEESSRIARKGQCLDLAKAKAGDYDALVIPGGFGVAKNLCGFAFHGPEATVRPDVEAFIGAFFEAGKPVGAICIAPAMVGLCLAKAGKKARLTLGSGGDVQAAMERLGHVYQPVPSPREVVIDEALKLVTTAAYMFDNPRLSDVWVGIERCVTEVVGRI